MTSDIIRKGLEKYGATTESTLKDIDAEIGKIANPTLDFDFSTCLFLPSRSIYYEITVKDLTRDITLKFLTDAVVQVQDGGSAQMTLKPEEVETHLFSLRCPSGQVISQTFKLRYLTLPLDFALGYRADSGSSVFGILKLASKRLYVGMTNGARRRVGAGWFYIQQCFPCIVGVLSSVVSTTETVVAEWEYGGTGITYYVIAILFYISDNYGGVRIYSSPDAVSWEIRQEFPAGDVGQRIVRFEDFPHKYWRMTMWGAGTNATTVRHGSSIAIGD